MPANEGEHVRIYQKLRVWVIGGAVERWPCIRTARLWFIDASGYGPYDSIYGRLRMSKPIFFDPDRRRWKQIRKWIDVTLVALYLLIIFFAITVVRKTNIPRVLLADQKKSYRALKLKEPKKLVRKGTHRQTMIPASQVVLNSGEGIRGAFYVTWDAASYSSLREYIHQIDFVFPEWLHVLTPDGHLQAVNENNALYPVITNRHVATIDVKVMPLIRSANAQVDVLPMVNNFDPIVNEFADVSKMLGSDESRERFRQEIGAFLASDNYKGLTLDLEVISKDSQPGYRALVAELASDLHQRNQKLYICVPAGDPEFDYADLAKLVDGLILMNYDQHYQEVRREPSLRRTGSLRIWRRRSR